MVEKGTPVDVTRIPYVHPSQSRSSAMKRTRASNLPGFEHLQELYVLTAGHVVDDEPNWLFVINRTTDARVTAEVKIRPSAPICWYDTGGWSP